VSNVKRLGTGRPKVSGEIEDAALVNHILQVPSLTAVAARKETNFLHDY
jgi:hypothetical protein